MNILTTGMTWRKVYYQMNKYKYEVVYSNKFKKSLKKVLKQGKDIKKLKIVVDKLANKEKLEPRFRNHSLINDNYYKDCSECHIESDWLLVYQYDDDKLVLILVNTGSHSEVLNM